MAETKAADEYDAAAGALIRAFEAFVFSFKAPVSPKGALRSAVEAPSSPEGASTSSEEVSIFILHLLKLY